MDPNIELQIGLTVIIISLLGGLVQFRKLDNGGRIILLLLFVVLLDELIAHYFAKKYHNNLVVYNIYGLVELCLMILYFSYINNFFGNKKIAFFLLIFGLSAGILNFMFFESFQKLNSVYIFFEGFIIIVLALITFYRLLVFNEDLKLYRHPHFWFASVFLFFWGVTYLNWGFCPLLKNKHTISQIIFFVWIVNIITYGSIGIIFQLYPKRSHYHE